ALRESFERSDARAHRGADGHRTGADGHAIAVHGAGAALAEAATELRRLEPEVVAQDGEKRHVGLDRDTAAAPVHVQLEGFRHRFAFIAMRGLAPALSIATRSSS